MGETFKQWLAISDIDLESACPPHADDPDYYRRPYRPGLDSNFKVAEDRSALCLQLMPIQYTGAGEFRKSNVLSDNDSDPASVDWTFADGKLALHSLLYSKSDMQQHVAFLTEAYGVPTTRKLVTYENGFGATWKRLDVMWQTGDGGLINLSELKDFDEAGKFMVIFISGAQVRKEAGQKKAANPYAQ